MYLVVLVESSDTKYLFSFTVFLPVSFPLEHHCESLPGPIPYKTFFFFLTRKIICRQALIELRLGRGTQEDVQAPGAAPPCVI